MNIFKTGEHFTKKYHQWSLYLLQEGMSLSPQYLSSAQVFLKAYD